MEAAGGTIVVGRPSVPAGRVGKSSRLQNCLGSANLVHYVTKFARPLLVVTLRE